MNFFEYWTDDRINSAARRTQRDISNAFNYASRHPVEAALSVGTLVTLAIYAPGPVVLTLLISALVLFYLNSASAPSENMFESCMNMFH